MLLNYIKIAFRQIMRNKLFTLINVTGLALSMSIGMLIIVMIISLLKFDAFHVNNGRIYRVISETREGQGKQDLKATAPIPLAQKLQGLSAVDKTVRIRKSLNDFVVQGNDEVLIQGYFTEPSFQQVFSFPFLRGNPESALAEPYSIVLTQRAARKLFNSEDVLGKTISFKQLGTYRVTGLMEDVPKHSHMLFEALASFSTVPILEQQVTKDNNNTLYPTSEHWDRLYNTYVYLLLKPGAAPEQVSVLFPDVEKVYEGSDFRAAFSLQPLHAIVPGPIISSEIGTKMIHVTLYVLSGLALLILAAACFNYTNLSIAKALQRAKEVGLRKISGAARRQILWQFLMESTFVALFALMLAIVVYDAITPYVMQNIPRATELFDLTLTPQLLILFFTFALFTGFVAGILPSMALAQVNIVEALKQVKNLRLIGRVGVRNSLVVFQFTISLFLFTALVIVYRQYQFSLSKDLGFDKENVLVVNLQGKATETFVNKCRDLSGIRSVTLSSNIPGTTSVNQSWVYYNNREDSLVAATMSSDAQYIREFGFRFVAGTNFPDTATVADAVIINESFLRVFGAATALDALDQTILIEGNLKRIIGVVRDFNYMQLENAIGPFLFENNPRLFRYANLKIDANNLAGLRSEVEGIWKQITPDRAFEGSFFVEHIEETYQFYVRLIRVFGFIGVVAMAIAILGLLGMASYSTERRTKEIGIRKVMGARVSQIILLLSKSFFTLLFVAALIALPAAYLLFDRVVLNVGVYRISIGILEMSLGFFIMLLVGCATILSQTMRVALANPVKALRVE